MNDQHFEIELKIKWIKLGSYLYQYYQMIKEVLQFLHFRLVLTGSKLFYERFNKTELKVYIINIIQIIQKEFYLIISFLNVINII